jgi:hypothetical protein
LLLPNEEKLTYPATLEEGDSNGWKPAGTRNLKPDIKDNFEIYNIPKFIPKHAGREYPKIVKNHINSIEKFSKHIHENTVNRLSIIFALALELDDEERFAKKYCYEKASGEHLRYSVSRNWCHHL